MHPEPSEYGPKRRLFLAKWALPAIWFDFKRLNTIEFGIYSGMVIASIAVPPPAVFHPRRSVCQCGISGFRAFYPGNS